MEAEKWIQWIWHSEMNTHSDMEIVKWRKARERQRGKRRWRNGRDEGRRQSKIIGKNQGAIRKLVDGKEKRKRGEFWGEAFIIYIVGNGAEARR
jgi:hypothetical protein